MPIVPTLEQPRVEAKTLRPQYSNLDTRGTHGEAIGQGVQQLGRGIAQGASAIGEIWQKERDKQTVAAIAGAEGQYQAAINAAFDDPDNGFMRRKGQEALDADPVLEGLEKTRQDLLGKLPTEDARRRFEVQSQGMHESARLRAFRHIGQQTDVIAQSNMSALAATSLDGLAGAYADPVTRAELLERPVEAIRALAVSPEDAAAKVADFKQKGHQVVLERFLSTGDVKGAEEYYAQAAGELGSAAGPVRKRIESEGRAIAGASEAARIFKDSLVEGSQWVDPASAFQKADALPEGPHKDEVFKNLREQVSRAEALKKQAGEAALGQLYSLQLQRGTTNTPEGRKVRDWMADPKNGAADLLYRFDKGLESERRANAYWNSQERRAQEEQDQLAMSRFLARPGDAQVATNIDTEFGEYASERARNQMRRYQNAAKSSLEKDAGVGESEFTKFVDAKAMRSGFKNNKSLVKDFKAAMNARRMQFLEEHNGKEPTRKDVSGWLADEMLYGDFGSSALGSAFSKNKYKFQVEPEDRESFKPFAAEDQNAAPKPGEAVPLGKEPPAPSVPKADKLTRAKQLRGQGLTPAQIAATMTSEGYR